MTCFTQGVGAGGAVLTGATTGCLVGVLLTCKRRIEEHRFLLTWEFLRQPPVLFSLLYFVVGIASGYFAEDKERYVREIIQRSLIIVLPLYLHVYGPKQPSVLYKALICYIIPSALLSAGVFLIALKSGMHAPIYMLGMHKNVAGANAAHLSVICAALLFARQNEKVRKLTLSLACIGILAIVGAQARAALLGTVIALFFMMAINREKKRHFVALLVTVVLSLGLLSVVLPKEAIDHVVTKQKFSSNAVREITWGLISKKLQDDPTMCVGWGNRIFAYLDEHQDSGFASVEGSVVPDCASIFYYDWGQMSIVGVCAQFAMFIAALILALINALQVRKYTMISAINLAAAGILVTRIVQSYLDSFWVGRGPTLITWAAVGMIVFVRLWTIQSKLMRRGNDRHLTSLPQHQQLAAMEEL